MVKQLIIMFCFFNVDLIERTLKTILASNFNSDIKTDILFLENASKYSNKLLELSTEYNISHYRANDNFGGHILTKFYMDYKHILDAYDLIAVTDSDAEIEPYAIQETINLLNREDLTNVGNCSILTKVNEQKYNEILPSICSWLGYLCDNGDYYIGVTGFQFINFKKQHYFDYFDMIIAKKLNKSIALGELKYTGPSDTNLRYFNKLQNKPWIVTKYNGLDHIGWESYLSTNSELYKDYLQAKQDAIATGKDRHNIADISVITLTVLRQIST
jgi:hypothetical protein